MRPPPPAICRLLKSGAPSRRSWRRALGAVLGPVVVLGGSACSHAFDAAHFTNPADLYRASNARLERRKWDDALAGFDRLATQLPARDTLLPRVYFAQGQAHARRGDHLLAAQAFARIQDAFPDDSLAPEALYQEAHEYQRLWSHPSLDPQYGQTALATYRQLLQLYPDAARVPDAGRDIAAVNQMFAAKDLETGMHYLRRKAYDPALIYFKDVVRLYPGTPAARDAYLHMVQSYGVINYKEERAEACAEMRRSYPKDAQVDRACAGVPAVTVAGISDTSTAPRSRLPRPVIDTISSAASRAGGATPAVPNPANPGPPTPATTPAAPARTPPNGGGGR